MHIFLRSVAYLSKIKYCSSFSIEVNQHANEVRIKPILSALFVSIFAMINVVLIHGFDTLYLLRGLVILHHQAF